MQRGVIEHAAVRDVQRLPLRVARNHSLSLSLSLSRSLSCMRTRTRSRSRSVTNVIIARNDLLFFTCELHTSLVLQL